MKAAVVEAFDRSPRYCEFAEPQARDDEVIISVRAAALSQLVRAQASGKHYTSGKPPFVPGADGVGVLANGQRVYFAFPRGPLGAMAERVAVKSAYTIALPDDVDDITAAAIANPAMSSWVALSERAVLKRGESVLVNGATGASGRLAIQTAKHLGAARIIATGRNPASAAELIALGADVFVPLNQSPEVLADRFRQEIAAGVDIVLDYLWGAIGGGIFSGCDRAWRR
jgi:NADPH:quinone reductase-like Zn-dependent oxidoreductase